MMFKKSNVVLSSISAAFIVLLFVSCGDDNPVDSDKVPVLTTASVSAITQTTAQCGGTITSDGGAAVTARGVCWSTDATPTIADNKTADSAGTGSFTSSLTGLAAGTLYYVRAYATNSAGTGYGSIKSFTTEDAPQTGTVTRLTSADGDSWHSHIGVDSDDNIHIAWQDNRDGNDEIYYTKLDNTGTTLIDDMRLTSDVAVSEWPVLDVDGQGNVHIIWRDSRDATPEVYYTKLDNLGNVVVDDTRLTVGSNNTWGYHLQVNSSDHVNVVWVDYRVGDPEIYYAKLDNSGAKLVDDTRLTTANGEARWPHIVVDNADNAHVLWYDARSGNGEICYEKLDSGGNTIVDDTRLTFSGTVSGAPHPGVDPSNNIHVLWPDTRDVDQKIYYSKLDSIGGTLVEDKAVTDISSSQVSWGYWSDMDGYDLHITWDDDRDGNSEIYYSKLDNNGNPLVQDIRITNDQSSSWWPRICVDNSHAFHIVWDDDRDGNREIYYTHEL
jgi:hypothetical protein